jgi:DNA repair exonuclease SbcCD ATPase subunit
MRMKEIASRLTEIRTLQEDFKTLHQDVESAKADLPSAEELMKQIQRKENDRASLSTRTVKAKEKAESCACSSIVHLLRTR